MTEHWFHEDSPSTMPSTGEGVDQSGDIRLTFADRTTMAVPADPDYEAWNCSLTGGELLVSLPGGGIAHFPPRP